MFASAGKTLNIYSLERGGLKTISKYTPKPSVTIKQVSWCHDNTYLAILPENECPQILSTKDPTSLALVHTISSIADVTALRFKSNTKRVMALGTRNGEVLLYDTKNRCVTHTLGQLPTEVRALEFNSPNELVAISNDVLALFNLTDSEQIEVSNPHVCTALKCLNKTSSGQIAVGCLNGMLLVWDVNTRSETNIYHLHSTEISDIAISNKDKLIITAGKDNKLCVIDHSMQECIFKKILHQPINSLDISANDQHMVAGLSDGSIYVYHMAEHLKPQICSKMQPTSINQISFVNGFTSDLLESDSFMEEDQNTDVNKTPNKVLKESDFATGAINEHKSRLEITEFNDNEPQLEPATEADDVEVSEEKVKLDLVKLVNANFSHLEEQLADHCGRLQTLVCSELDSLYAVAARWECFKTMELEEIVRYICGIVSASSETRIASNKSEHTHLQQDGGS